MGMDAVKGIALMLSRVWMVDGTDDSQTWKYKPKAEVEWGAVKV